MVTTAVAVVDDLEIESLDHSMSLPARMIKSGLKLNALRTNAILHKDEWEELDRVVVQVAANVLVGVADLEAAGLTVSLGGLGTLVSGYERSSDMSPASVNMAADVDDAEDLADFQLVGVPVPIVSKGFRMDIRHLMASRQNGSGVDLTNAEIAARKVSEGLENILFNGSTTVQRGNTIYGYLNHPSRNTGTGATWATSTNIIPNVVTMLSGLSGDNYVTGPYNLYLNPAQHLQLLIQMPNTSRPILSYIQEILPGGAVRQSQYVPSGQAVLVAMNRSVVDLAIGQSPIPIEWTSKGPLVTYYRVIAAMVPRVKADYDGRSGIYHMSGI